MKRLSGILILLAGFISRSGAQEYIWADTLQYTNDRGITAVTHDTAGNIYFATAAMSGLNLLSTYYCGDIHIRKYTPDGSLLWDTYFWGNGRIFDLHIDAEGNLIAAGGYTNSITIEGISYLTGPFLTGALLIKLNNSGNVLWEHVEEPTVFNSMINSVTTDATSHIYVTGLLDDVTALLRKYNREGTMTDDIPMGFVRTGSDVEVDANGQIFLAGSAPDYATIDGIGFPPEAIGTGYTNFMVRYDTDFIAQEIYAVQYFTFDFTQALSQYDGSIYFRCTAYDPALFAESDILVRYSVITGLYDTVRIAPESFGTFDHPFTAVNDTLLCLLASTSTQNKILRINTDGWRIDSVMIPKLNAEVEHFTYDDNAAYFGGTIYSTTSLDTISIEPEAGDLYQPFIAKYAFPEITEPEDVCHALFEFTTTDSMDYQFTDLSTPSTASDIVVWFWNFCDGGTSSLQNPEHIYSLFGSPCACLTITDSQGCTDTYCVSSTSVNTIESTVTIAPNPVVQHRFELNFPEKIVAIHIYDISGKNIPFHLVENDSGHHSIYLPDTAPGMYLIRVEGSSMHAQSTFVVSN